MEQVDPGLFFIGAAPLPEMLQRPVTHWLLQEGSGVQCILETDVEHECGQHVLVRQAREFLENQGSNLDVHRRVGPGVLPAVQDGIRSFVYLWKDMLHSLTPIIT